MERKLKQNAPLKPHYVYTLKILFLLLFFHVPYRLIKTFKSATTAAPAVALLPPVTERLLIISSGHRSRARAL